jgi:monoamine oxidase
MADATEVETLIVGGGLSGLAIADALETQGRDYLLLEARDRFGGRISTGHVGDAAFDLGPAWFWQGQPRIAALIKRLGLKSFEQFSDGIQLFEDARGQVHRSRGFASMQGSLRVEGGLGAVTQALGDRLPDERKRLDAPVVSLDWEAERITATLSKGDRVRARTIILALPPRLAAEIVFTPALSDTILTWMRDVPTWMAGQAKAVAIYDRPFWREAGLSGDASSRFGPLLELHDASPATAGPCALFGFVGVPPQARADADALRQSICAQLGRLFGPQAAAPAQIFLKDWAFDAYTATPADRAPLYAHPVYGLPPALGDPWADRLHLAGTEVAPQFGGYVEGALEAAEYAVAALGTRRGNLAG